MPVSLELNWSPYKRLLNSVPPFDLQSNALCPYCQTGQGEELFCLNDLQCFEDRGGQNRFIHRIVFCESCGMVYTDPWFTPDGARWLMERAGASYGHCNPVERVDWILNYAPEARSILDLGCGEGSFLGAFPEEMTLSGVEADEHMVRTGKLKFPHVHLTQGDVENPGLLPKADLITLFHILEHLSDPLEFLITLKKRVGPASRLLVEVPILERAVETHGPDICGFFSIPHRSHFSRKTLTRMLSKSGWNVEHTFNLDGNGYRVLASSESLCEDQAVEFDCASEKRLARDYVQCREASIKKVRGIIDQLPREGDFVIWGAGHHTEFLERLTTLFSSKRRFLLVDNDPSKSGNFQHGIPIVEPSALSSEQWRSGEFNVIISSYCWQEPILQDLILRGVKPSKITRLYP